MSEKFVPFEKMSKRKQKAMNAERRDTNGFNTGTRIHQVKSNYDRKAMKAEMRAIMRSI